MPIQRKKQPRLYAGVKQDQRIPNKTGHVAFIDVGEERMKWQRTVSETDALYQLPDTRSRCGTPFGTSTRSDWENTMKSKRDLYNPYASPGNYNPPLNVTLRAPPSIKFGYSTRLERYGRNKTPGPDYNIDGIYSNGPTCGRVKLGFAKSKRPNLLTSATDASYFPRFPKGKSAPLTGRNFFGLKEEQSRSPGPVYDTAKYDFGKPAVRSRRPVVLWCFHFIQTTRVHQTRSWLVSFSISRQFGPHRATAMLRAGERHRLPGRPLLVRCGPELRPVQAAGPAHDPLGGAALVYGRVAAMASGRRRKLTTLRRDAVDATRSTQGGC